MSSLNKKNISSFTSRTARVKKELRANGMDAMLISNRSDVFYLTGGFFDKCFLLISSHGGSVFFIDRMNAPLAAHILRNKGIKIIPGNIYEQWIAYMKKSGIKRIWMDKNDLSFSEYSKLNAFAGKSAVGIDLNIVKNLRKIKDKKETALLRKAAIETISIWRKFSGKISYGMQEKGMKALLETLIHGEGYETSFDTIVASGRNSFYPHAIAGGKTIKKGEHLLVDFGIKVSSYASDLTRIWVKGRMNRKIEEIFDVVKRVQYESINSIKPGVVAGTIAKKANKIFVECGLGKYIYHGLGHGVGIDIHEGPFISEQSSDILEAGMVITVEPGLYIPGLGGIRVEDMVLINKKGCEVLTQ